MKMWISLLLVSLLSLSCGSNVKQKSSGKQKMLKDESGVENKDIPEGRFKSTYRLITSDENILISILQVCKKKAECFSKVAYKVELNGMLVKQSSNYIEFNNIINGRTAEEKDLQFTVDFEEIKSELKRQHFFDVYRCRNTKIGKQLQKVKFGFRGDWAIELPDVFRELERDNLLVYFSREGGKYLNFEHYNENESILQGTLKPSNGSGAILKLLEPYQLTLHMNTTRQFGSKNSSVENVELPTSPDFFAFRQMCDDSYDRFNGIVVASDLSRYGEGAYLPEYNPQIELDKGFIKILPADFLFEKGIKDILYPGFKIYNTKILDDLLNDTARFYPKNYKYKTDPLWIEIYAGESL